MFQEAELLEYLKIEIGVGLISSSVPREGKICVTVKPTVLRTTAEALLKRGSRFVTITAIDGGLDLELIYHFDLSGTLITLKTIVEKEVPKVDTIADLTPAAEWAEKEVAELFGISFRAHPRPGHFLLPDEWPAGKHPLAKPFKSELPEQLCQVAESLITSGATAPISPLIKRKREEIGLPAQPPASYASEPWLREVHELVQRTDFSKKVGYDWKKRKLRGK
ncbi:MAG: NADH-quinone oxidoreductase subunit C [Candidatus Hodarchaeaceae archaeon]|nr:NADH-quinone oxidoreductase subunit C [Candidatus Hodarchaeaceae archaeon]